MIQMLLPEGKNKKYAEVVSGLYILYIILNPILNMDDSFAITNLQNKIEEISYESGISQEQISRNYLIGIENDLKGKIEEKGYQVEYIQFYITSDYNTIVKIEVKMKTGTQFQKNEVQKIVLENFAMEEDKISILE